MFRTKMSDNFFIPQQHLLCYLFNEHFFIFTAIMDKFEIYRRGVCHNKSLSHSDFI